MFSLTHSQVEIGRRVSNQSLRDRLGFLGTHERLGLLID